MQEKGSRSFPVSTRVMCDHVFYLGFRQIILHFSAINISVLVSMLGNDTFIKEFRTESLRWSHVMRLEIMQSLLISTLGGGVRGHAIAVTNKMFLKSNRIFLSHE